MSVSVAQEPALSLLYQLSEGYEPRDFAIRFWDGTTTGPDSGQEARFTVVLNHPGALRRMLWPFNQKYALGEAYIYGDFDVDGDLSAFILLLKHWIEKKWTARQKLSLLKSVLALPGGPTVAELSSVGVHRISVGGAFAYVALGAVVLSLIHI